MAEFELDIPDNIINILKSLDVDEIAPEMLNEAAPELANKVKANIPSEMKNYASKIKISKPKKSKNGAWISNINWTGSTPRSKDNLRNAELMAYWEYGSSKNPPTGFMRKSVKESASSVQNKMAEVAKKKFEEAFGK